MSKDISILVVEQSVDPIFDIYEQQVDIRHDISRIVYYLDCYNIKPDLVWTLSK